MVSVDVDCGVVLLLTSSIEMEDRCVESCDAMTEQRKDKLNERHRLHLYPLRTASFATSTLRYWDWKVARSYLST